MGVGVLWEGEACHLRPSRAKFLGSVWAEKRSVQGCGVAYCPATGWRQLWPVWAPGGRRGWVVEEGVEKERWSWQPPLYNSTRP